MTDNQAAVTHADFQRAAALIGHEANGSAEGMQFVIDQACALNRASQLLLAVVDAYGIIAAELRTDAALIAVWQLVAQETRRTDDDDARRAATVIVARRDHNADTFNAVMREANQAGRPAELLATVVALYATILPELATPHATEHLAQWTARIAGQSGADQ